MASYLDLLKLLPKTNCRECGEESCLLFALKVFSRSISPDRCPYLKTSVLPAELSASKITFDQTFENLKYLREKFRNLENFLERAENLGCQMREEGNSLLLSYLDIKIEIALGEGGKPLEIRDWAKAPLDPRDEILLCNYFLFNGKDSLSLNFVGLESFPHSISKVKTLKAYGEDPLAELMSSCSPALEEILRNFIITDYVKLTSGTSFIVWVLPRVPLKITFWEGDLEEGLSPSCKILYDQVALSYLDLECLVFCAERLVEKLKAKVSIGG
ncbi:MAG: DUF3786 domain-containing protein [Caldimicrobium sp.]|nr:DUF3786 domain-containing protein [Caldimicrobium sp.]MCX7613551.1 DUF3786 domain-containing protein [Caldimicrobium sp.]MDW8182253.1 DUF3786 domain-containing protein [Caldimicrobium sp.]